MISNLIKTVGVGVLTLTMGILPLSSQAQAQVNDRTTDGTQTTRTTYDERDNNDWGWLGLIGLLGLAGLAGKKHDTEPTRYRETNTPNATSYRD